MRYYSFRKIPTSIEDINVLLSYAQGLESSIKEITESQEYFSTQGLLHLKFRQQSEEVIFLMMEKIIEDQPKPKSIVRGCLSHQKNSEEIIALNPDIIVSYRCLIIKAPLLSAFKDRIINAHLGLSPYYRGCGTNFWPQLIMSRVY